jgi:hypothetical protein
MSRLLCGFVEEEFKGRMENCLNYEISPSVTFWNTTITQIEEYLYTVFSVFTSRLTSLLAIYAAVICINIMFLDITHRPVFI